ncbi:Os-9 [Thalictrum thalictroides]|uniref:Os-9 n=1 Tax=Thalictrum thalictroides TaxID=46969 RepID=A0A7J6W749_THATH|nr:Os-9 [Thalictrum thalictroides]
MCDLTNQPRETEVRYVCSEPRAVITSITELSTCKYALTLHSPMLCKQAPNVSRTKTSNAVNVSSGAPVIKKRLPKKIRQVPDYYFLPRRSLLSVSAIYGACIAAGIGAGMLIEVWVKKKIKEDGGIIWEKNKD